MGKTGTDAIHLHVSCYEINTPDFVYTNAVNGLSIMQLPGNHWPTNTNVSHYYGERLGFWDDAFGHEGIDFGLILK